jgi:hypothetical protein
LSLPCCCTNADTPIVSVKILNEKGEGPSSNIILGCTWLLQDSLDGVTPNDDNMTNAAVLGVDVINMSFGAPGSPFSAGTLGQICNVMRLLRDAGVVSVAAAGKWQHFDRVEPWVSLTLITDRTQTEACSLDDGGRHICCRRYIQ